MRFDIPNKAEPYLAVSAAVGFAYMGTALYDKRFNIPADFNDPDVARFFFCRILEAVVGLWGCHGDLIDLTYMLLIASIPNILVLNAFMGVDLTRAVVSYMPSILALPVFWGLKQMFSPDPIVRAPGQKYPRLNRSIGPEATAQALVGALILTGIIYGFADGYFSQLLRHATHIEIANPKFSLGTIFALLLVPCYGIQRVAGDLDLIGVIQFIALLRSFEMSHLIGDSKYVMPLLALPYGASVAFVARLLPGN
ncbi:hypothetical protein CANCADRAFT_32392 [Tortispora caseinolytica NRRL Y-17796]|uniref:Uncharacterized protein n=1 Tax=Tortispora caseinolytica NRRL Y-17796 TaxID=767744 RepID=A0A1E4TBG2_9ASCO|nr:hypothetical protein CANCADRAFT_32392 [Tortispora caseinolytica NRRL Y-17796]